MYSLASSTAQISSSILDLGTSISLVLGGVLVALFGLLGLGFALDKIVNYVAGTTSEMRESHW